MSVPFGNSRRPRRSGDGKLYLCAIEDVYSNRIVGYSIDSRMKSRIAVNALNNAVARRGELTRGVSDRLDPAHSVAVMPTRTTEAA